MGMLSAMAPAAEAVKNFNAVAGRPSKLFDAVRSNPQMAKSVTNALAMAFPPARGAALALEMADAVNGIAVKLGLADAAKFWGQAQGEGTSFFDRLKLFASKVHQAKQAHRVSA